MPIKWEKTKRVPTLDYLSWGQNLRRKIAGTRLPLGGTIELTRRCNNRCAHCYNNLPAEDASLQAVELGGENWKRILDEAAEAGCLYLLFTGGEPLLHPDFAAIYAHARRRGFLVTLFTNGRGLTEQTVDLLASIPPLAVEVSLYGASRDTWERVTRVCGSYAQSLAGIERLRRRGLHLRLKTTLSRINHHELPEMRRLAASWGVPFRFDAFLNGRLDGSRKPLSLRLSPEEVVALDLADPARVRALRQAQLQPVSPACGGYACGAGVHAFALDPYGKLRLCALAAEKEGFDLTRQSFRDGWGDWAVRERKRLSGRSSRCLACGLLDLCGVCPPAARLEGGEESGPVAFLCEVAHLRALVFGIPVPAHGPCDFCPGGERHEKIASRAAALRNASPFDGRNWACSPNS